MSTSDLASIVTNTVAAQVIGLSPSGCSRLFSNTRTPSWATMAKVERVLGWQVDAQARLISDQGDYGNTLRRKIGEHLAEAGRPYDSITEWVGPDGIEELRDLLGPAVVAS